ncbi:MAG TPA: ChrR family anti-sigma-E factor [Spongiibacteraceae bacterium]|nr:ChrR family anti-sigma-E factor [Spongiibacteraceae bacterium]
MKHHPEFSWLEQYAAATLPLPVALCVSTHLSFCGECRRQLDLLQNLGGLLFAQLEPMPVADELLQRILGRIDEPRDEIAEVVKEPMVVAPMSSVAPEQGSAIENNVDHIPQPLCKLIGAEYRNVKWSRMLPSLHAANLSVGDQDYSVALHRVKPGGKIPRHDHRGQEFTVVLRGSFSDEYGIYSDGDFILREPGDEHLPLAARYEECICLTVQQAPVRFTGLFWRCLNPLLR